MPLWSEMLKIISLLLIWLRLVLCSKMRSVLENVSCELEKKCVFWLLFGCSVWKYQLSLNVLLYHLRPLLPYWFLSERSIFWCEWGVEVSYYYCIPSVSLFMSTSIYICLVAKSCPTLSEHMNCSLPGSSVHGILWARILEWVAIPFFMVSSWPRDQTYISHTAGRFFTSWATREAHFYIRCMYIDECKIFFLHWSFYNYVVSFFIFLHSFFFNICFV